MNRHLHPDTHHILLVDDDTNVREILQSILEFNGYAVTSMEGSVPALHFYQESHPGIDLVITDLNMPEMTGVDFAERIRQISPNQIIFGMSAFVVENQGQQEYNKVFDELISKPFKSRKLLVKIVQHLP